MVHLKINNIPVEVKEGTTIVFDMEEVHDIAVNVGVFILSIFIAWAALKLYDLPVREWLKKF